MNKLSLLTKFAAYKVNSLFREDDLSDFILSQIELGAVTKKLAQIKQTKIISLVKLDGRHKEEILSELKKCGFEASHVEDSYRPGSMANIYFIRQGEKKFCFKRYHPDLGARISKSIDQLMTAGKFYAWKKNFELDSEKFSLQLKSVLLNGLEGEEEARKTNLFRDAFPEIVIPKARPYMNAVVFDYIDFLPAISTEQMTSEEISSLPGDLLSFMIESSLKLKEFHADLNFENWGIDRATRKLSVIDFGETIQIPGAFVKFIEMLRIEKANLSEIGYIFPKQSVAFERQLEIAQIIFAPFLASENFYISTWNPQERLKSLLGDEYIKLRESSPSWILFYLRSMFFITKFCEQHNIKVLTLKISPSLKVFPDPPTKKRLHISVVKDGDEIVNVLFPATVAFRLESVLEDELLERIKKTHDLTKIDESFSYEELNDNRKITVKFVD